MRAVVLTEDRPRLELVELPDPEPGPGEVLLEVTGCGICGSDLHVACAVAPAGMVLGHEIAGTVAALGTGVDVAAWRIGEAVAARPMVGCGACTWCGRGRPDHCARFQLLGLARAGGFAELTTVPARELFRLPAVVTGVEQALVEPLAVARRAVVRGGVVPTDSVAILGAGPIGLAILAWVRHLGIEQVTVTDPSTSRRALARELGASATIDPLGDEAAMAELERSSPTVVFECVGRPGMIGQAMDVAAVEGRVVVVGVCLSPDTTFPFTGLHKELDVRYAIYYGRDDFTATIDVLGAHGLHLDGFVEGTVGLAELPAQFARLLEGAVGGKVVLAP